MKTRIVVLGAVAFFSLNSALIGLSVPQSTLSCAPPAPGLVGWWPAEGSADDVIGGNNGTLEGGATFAPGKVGQGFRFDGTNGYVQIPDSDALKPTNLTVEAWVWLDPSLPSGRGGEQIVFKKNTWDAWFEGYSLLKETIDNGDGTYSDRFQFCISRYGDQVAINSQTIAQRGVWYHVAATYDGNRSVLYVNGVAEASATPGFALDYATTPVFIGTTGTWPPYLSMFGGIIDEVSIYNRALSSNEIAAIYGAGSAGKCSSQPLCVPPPSDLVSWWRAEDNANDSIGTNNGLLENVTFTNGVVGQAFQLNGSNADVQIPYSTTLQPTNITVEAWVKLDALTSPVAAYPGLQYIVFKKNSRDGNFEGYDLEKNRINGQDVFRFQVTSAAGEQVPAASTTVPQVGVWYHLAGTYDGTTVKIYVNGVLEGSAVAGFPMDYGTRPVFIGTTGEWWDGKVQGAVDEVSIYKRALSSNEIAALYQAGSAGKCTSSSCVSPPSGLVSWWPGEGNANDVVGTNNGTLVNGVTFTAGKVGQAFHLDGTNQYVQIPDSPSLKPTNVSVEAWVKLDTLATPGANIPGQQIIVFKKNTRSGNFEGYTLLKDRVSGQDCFSFAIASAGGLQIHALSKTVPQVGSWYHLVGTYDGATLRLYVNGVLEGSAYAGFPLDYGTRPVFFGRTGEFWVANFGGSIDEVSLYNRALTAEEIQSLYDAGSAGKCPPVLSCDPAPSGIVSWWPGEGNGNDIVGTNNGIVSGNLSYAAGEVGQAFVFNDGTADVRIPASTSINVGLGNGFTVEAWISPTTLAPQPVFEWNSGTGYDDIGAHLWVSGGPSGPGPAGNLYANVRDNFGVGHFITSGGGVVVSNHLQHVALTYDKASGMAVLYCNGVAVQTQTLGVFTPKTDYDLHLGRRIGGYYSGAYYLGSIDEASLYKRALSASEIQAIYNAGAAGKCAPLVAPIILVQPQGQTVNAGNTATFSVTAEGSLPLFYQWLFNSNALSGTTSTTLTLTNTRPDQGGWYSVVVSNAAGVAVSSNALLLVNQIPVADASATVTRVFVCTCTDTNTAVVLDGTRSYDLDGDPLQYLWFENGMSTPLGTGAVAVVRLPPGTYPIELAVSDGLAADTNVVVVKVLTATGAIGDLTALINSSDIAHPQQLIASLSAASDSIARCNLAAAVSQLGAFQNKVLAQIAPDDSPLAGMLMASAQEVINSLGNCGGFQNQKHGRITADHGQSGSKVHLKFEGNRGQTYIIEASSDLADWEKIGVATDLQDGNFEFDDNNWKGTPVRFYRVVTP